MGRRYGRHLISLPRGRALRAVAYDGTGARASVLTAADLEVNVLEFRQRSFQFARVAEVGGESYAVFTRTETESERQLRPRLIHLTVVSPLAWVALDAAADLLRCGPAAGPDAAAVEVSAEPPEFEADGHRWRRTAAGDGRFLYVPAERETALRSPEAKAALGLA